MSGCTGSAATLWHNCSVATALVDQLHIKCTQTWAVGSPTICHHSCQVLESLSGCTGSAATLWHNCSVATAHVDHPLMLFAQSYEHQYPPPCDCQQCCTCCPKQGSLCKFHSCDCFTCICCTVPISGLWTAKKFGICMHSHTTCAQHMHAAVPAA